MRIVTSCEAGLEQEVGELVEERLKIHCVRELRTELRVGVEAHDVIDSARAGWWLWARRRARGGQHGKAVTGALQPRAESRRRRPKAIRRADSFGPSGQSVPNPTTPQLPALLDRTDAVADWDVDADH